MALGRNTLLLISLLLCIKLITHAWHNSHHAMSLGKRDASPMLDKCQDVDQHADQCAFVLNHCTDATPGAIDYMRLYYCSSTAARPVVLFVMCAWLLFLFGFVGIAASDFFCPNLQTIASALHLSESLTGVTFLAFGNGSPDLFSTFSAMHSNMGSLALGELIGAASFIVSVVAGSMCAIKPFRAKKLSFLRDVSFFTVAILLVMGIVADGLIHLYEAIMLIVFYIVYVAVVVGGNYYMKRRSSYLNLVQRARLEYEETGTEVDDLLRGNDWTEPELHDDEMELYDEGFESEGLRGDYTRHRAGMHPRLRIRTSLFSAIEFQDVVTSLQRTNARFYNRHHRRHSAHRDASPVAQDTTTHVPLTARAPPEADSPAQDLPPILRQPTVSLRWRRLMEKLGMNLTSVTFHLFPSLTQFRQKSTYSKVSSVISAPVIFLLTITLPVVQETAIQQGVALNDDTVTMLHEMEDDPADMTSLHESTSSWSQWLTAAQFVCAPWMIALVLTMNHVGHPAILFPVATVVGVGTAVLFMLTTRSERQPRLYWMMAFFGFVMAVVWIYVIANEVVSVLQAIGSALGISEAILGLTIFAVGNSLGDLVANVTMARLGYPLMAMSACFGGPMLNIMLGVGIGATYVTSQRHEPYAIDVSSSIVVSAVGLLVVLVSSLILVPLNGFRMSKAFGYAWIGVYLVCTAINLILETRS